MVCMCRILERMRKGMLSILLFPVWQKLFQQNEVFTGEQYFNICMGRADVKPYVRTLTECDEPSVLMF